MTDEDIARLLRSDHSIVVIEAPAGCGKTHQAANYAVDALLGLKSGRLLVLTHTHAACSVVAGRTSDYKDKIDIRTLDSLIVQIASAYRHSLDLPEDVFAWARINGYEVLAAKVAKLLLVNRFIAKHVATSYPIVICDEHQDSSEAQDKIVQLIGEEGALLRIFGDPMQIIPGGGGQSKTAQAAFMRWDSIKARGAFGELETPHRWKDTNLGLGKWILGVRQALKNGQPIHLVGELPAGVNVVFAEDGSPTPSRYQLVPDNWAELNRILNQDSPMLLLAASNQTIQNLRATFRPRFPIWEGHRRSNLEKFVQKLVDAQGDLDTQALAFLEFLQCVLVGFSNSTYGNRLIREIGAPTKNPRGDIPPHLKAMAGLVRDFSNSIGFSLAADYLKTLITQNTPGFSNLHIDYRREFDDLIKLRGYECPRTGFDTISHRRSRTYPKPPTRALSTIHKSKGLEAKHVCVFACDRKHFPGTKVKGNLFYVALSRATQSITIVASRNNVSPLVGVN